MAQGYYLPNKADAEQVASFHASASPLTIHAAEGGFVGAVHTAPGNMHWVSPHPPITGCGYLWTASSHSAYVWGDFLIPHINSVVANTNVDMGSYDK